MAEPIAPRGEPRQRPAAQQLPAPGTSSGARADPAAGSPKKRRRWLGWVIALAVILVLLVPAFFVGDALARQYATDYVRDRIIEALKLPADADVVVDVGGGSILLQAAAGAIDNVNIQVASLPLGDVTSKADITVTGVPLDSAKPVKSLRIKVTVDQANVRKLRDFLSGVDLTSIELRDKLIRISTEVDLFFTKLPVSVDLKPSGSGGSISFEPVTVLLGDQEVSVADLKAIPGLGGVAGNLLGSRDFCVASSLPKDLAIDSVDVEGTNLVLRLNGDGAALGGPGLSQMGSCPPQ